MHTDPYIAWLIKPLVAVWVRGPAGQRRAAALFGLLFTACWTSAPQSGKTGVVETTPKPAADEVRATVRIDAQPGGKKFQGVWLELPGTSEVLPRSGRWVIDYRATEIWRSFEDADVIVTGEHYQPFGQAINSPHYKVATMRFARPPSRTVPLRSIGPEKVLRGAFVEHVWPPGTRHAGDVERSFTTDDGATYGLAAGSADPKTGPAAITCRDVEPDPAYAADTGGPKVFVIRVHAHAFPPERVR